jgi:hypothetical protein
MSQTNTTSYSEPRDPNRLIGLSYFLTTVGAGILLANNWKRLGKPEWTRITLILSIAAGIIAIGTILGLIVILTSAPNQRNLIWLLFPGIGIAFEINFGYMFVLANLQNGAYKKWKREGQAAMLAHTYDVQRAVIYFLAFVVLSTVGFTMFYVLSNSNR